MTSDDDLRLRSKIEEFDFYQKYKRLKDELFQVQDQMAKYNNPLWDKDPILKAHVSMSDQRRRQEAEAQGATLYGQDIARALHSNYQIKDDHKTKVYKVIIKNLYKKLNFQYLGNEVAQRFINQEKYDYELKNKPDKYIVSQNINYTEEEFNTIREVVADLGLDISIDEAEEITSACLGSFNKYIDVNLFFKNAEKEIKNLEALLEPNELFDEVMENITTKKSSISDDEDLEGKTVEEIHKEWEENTLKGLDGFMEAQPEILKELIKRGEVINENNEYKWKNKPIINKKPSELLLEVFKESSFSKTQNLTPFTTKLLEVIDQLNDRIENLEVYHQIQQGIDECDLKEKDKSELRGDEWLDDVPFNLTEDIPIPDDDFPFVTQQNKEMVKDPCKEDYWLSDELLKYVLNTIRPESILRELAKRGKDDNKQICTLNERRFLDYIKKLSKMNEFGNLHIHRIGYEEIIFYHNDISRELNILDDTFNFGDFK